MSRWLSERSFRYGPYWGSANQGGIFLESTAVFMALVYGLAPSVRHERDWPDLARPVARLAVLLENRLDVFVEGNRRGIRHHHDACHAGDNDGCCSKHSGHLLPPARWSLRHLPGVDAAALARSWSLTLLSTGRSWSSSWHATSIRSLFSRFSGISIVHGRV